MAKQLFTANDAKALRHKAEETLAANGLQDITALSSVEISRLVHELQVHQIELELQNDEFSAVQIELVAERERYVDLYDLAPVGYCTLSEEGLILKANLMAATLLGVKRNQLIGRPITKFIHQNDQDNYYIYHQKFSQSDQPQSCDVRIVRKDDTVFWANLVTTMQSNRDHASEYRVVLYDLTEEKKQKDIIVRAEREWTDAFDAIQDGVMLHDPENNIMRANKAYKELSGAEKFKEIIGKPYYYVFPKLDEPMDTCKESKESGKATEEEFMLDDGRMFKSRSYPVFDDAGDYSFGIHLFEDITDIRTKEKQLIESLDGTIHSLAMMVEARDPYTAGHQNRVASLAVAIAKKMDMSESRIEGLNLAASIHDLGKIQIPAEILSKPGKLSNLEYMLIQSHSETGYEILKDINFPWPIAQIIRQHHEKMDGSGYPHGLKGEDILLEARILCVADMVEAIASHRPYRPALGIAVALDEIKKERATKLDAAVVDACITIFREKEFDFLA